MPNTTLGCFLVHLADLAGIDAGRLFAHDMDAPLHAFHGIAGMIIVGDGDDAGIDQAAVEHGDRIIKVCQIGREVFLCPCNAGRVDIRNGDEFNIRNPVFLHKALCVGRTLIADADDAETNFFSHNTCLLLIMYI